MREKITQIDQLFFSFISKDAVYAIGIPKHAEVNLKSLVKDLLQIKQQNDNEFQVMKLMGDAYLKPFVLTYFYEQGLRGDLEEKTRGVIGNSGNAPMPQFFDQFVKPEHDKTFPNEVNSISDHGKADVELARKNRDSVSYKFIVMHLLEATVEHNGH